MKNIFLLAQIMQKHLTNYFQLYRVHRKMLLFEDINCFRNMKKKLELQKGVEAIPLPQSSKPLAAVHVAYRLGSAEPHSSFSSPRLYFLSSLLSARLVQGEFQPKLVSIFFLTDPDRREFIFIFSLLEPCQCGHTFCCALCTIQKPS